MAVLTQDDLLESIDKMTVLELSEFIIASRSVTASQRQRPSRQRRPRRPAAAAARQLRLPRSSPSSRRP